MSSNFLPTKELQSIWNQVPINYYEDGERKNLGQRLWHSRKRQVFAFIFRTLKKTPFFKNKKVTVLDLGCADGHLTSWLVHQWPGGNIWGIDVVAKLINAAAKKYPGAKFKLGDAHQIPFDDNYFDLIVCSETLEHVIDPLKVCREARRVLKKGGVLVMELDTGSRLFTFLWYFWTHFGAGRVWDNAHLHQFDHKTLPQVISRAGLRVNRVIIHHLGMATTVVATK